MLINLSLEKLLNIYTIKKQSIILNDIAKYFKII